MYHRFGTIMESDVISSRESTNTLKVVGIGLDKVFTGVEWRSEVTSDLSTFWSRFPGWESGSCLLLSLTAQISWIIPRFDEEGRPSMAGPGLSATNHLVWRCFEHWWPLAVHSMAVSKAPNCGMFDLLYAISLVLQGQSPVGLPSVVICLGNNLAKTWSGITLPLAPVLTLHWRLPHWFGPISGGLVTVDKVSVSASMKIAVVWHKLHHIGHHSHSLHQHSGSAFVFHH